MRAIKRNFTGLRRTDGMTMAELLISVAIFSLAIIAAVAVLRKGSEISIADGHRKRARALIDSCFESPSCQPANYAALAAAARAVLIDPRAAGTADDLSGTLNITVAAETNNSTGTTVPYKRVTVSVTWQEPEAAQTITLDKLITEL